MEVKSTASPRLLNDFILLCIMFLVVIKIELELLVFLIIGISVRCTASGFINWHLLETEYFSKKKCSDYDRVYLVNCRYESIARFPDIK